AKRFRGALPARAKPCPRRFNGAIRRQKLAVLSSSVMTPTHRRGFGINGRFTTFLPTAPRSPRAQVGTVVGGGWSRASTDFAARPIADHTHRPAPDPPTIPS